MGRNFEIQSDGPNQTLRLGQFDSASGAPDLTKGGVTMDMHDIWAASAGCSGTGCLMLKIRAIGLCDLTTGEPVNMLMIASDPFPPP